MKYALACSATLTAFLLVSLWACGGGSGPSETPTPTTAAAPPTTPPAIPAGPSTTLAGGGQAEEDFPPPLLAWAEVEPEDGDAPLMVQFKADIEGGVPPLKYKWTFGDGTPESTESNPKHTYEKTGKYRADLYVENTDGQDSDSDYVEIEVKEPAKP